MQPEITTVSTKKQRACFMPFEHKIQQKGKEHNEEDSLKLQEELPMLMQWQISLLNIFINI